VRFMEYPALTAAIDILDGDLIGFDPTFERQSLKGARSVEVRTAVILAGGLNSRMGGRNKAFLSVGSQRILDRICNTLAGLFEKRLLVTNAPLSYVEWDVEIITDLFPLRSSLTGIHAALVHTPESHVFVTACDTPFIRPGLVQALLGEAGSKWDVVIPVTERGHQPLCAIYSKRCLKPMERQLEKADPRISNVFSVVRVKEVPEEVLRRADPELLSFVNVNTPEDLAACESLEAPAGVEIRQGQGVGHP
jgi:molybdopterin-guanine dinucleotide biosynthesis protein A